MRKDIFAVCPWMAELSRDSPAELRSALPWVKKHLAPASTSGPEDVLGQWGDVPSDGTSLLSMTVHLQSAWPWNLWIVSAPAARRI